ncbi:cyclic di-GMP phosphodiesterase [Paramixta manurensis]|uniref:cyclic-guanylate-specific phosphodiesterase n=1 Tax=Paramixta manurensis TaxID=2740817 RepID=A0A6M8URW2_9GAMM|nr:cyclic di-GMP phosphodiesterase [Erwiniaceae bacterium PD-1]
MGISTAVTRHTANPRKIAWISAVIGFICSLIVITLAFGFIYQKRAQQHDQLVNVTRQFVINAFNELTHTLLPLLPLVGTECHNVNSELTSRAAFASNIRAILLVHDGNAYCSSATGAFLLSTHKISPKTALNKIRDLTLLPGTPMLPHKPAMVLWLRKPGTANDGIMTTLNLNFTPFLLLTSRHQEMQGMALVSGNQALTTWNNRVIDVAALPAHPLRQFSIPGYPLTLLLYGEALPERDIHLVLLAGLLLAMLIGSSCFVWLTRRVRPGKEILLGIKRGEFYVEYQPLIEASTGHACALEALLRWTHPSEGPIPPDAFISYAEGQNLIIPLTRHLFDLVARDAKKLKYALPAGMHIGLNLSPSHLASPDFQRDVMAWIDAMPADHFNYVFEITERTMVSEKNAGEIFAWLHQKGIQIAIDDFGTGHSALIYLEKFKFDYLKIDRGFVQSIGMETVTSPVLDAVLNLAKKLNLQTVAEGVETGEQAAWLVNRGVTYLQGYLFSYPLNAQRLIRWFRQQERLP